MELEHNTVPDFLVRSQIQSPLKEKMARKDKRFIHPGQLDFIAPSTTLEQLCHMIAGIDLQVVTNSVDNAFALMNSPLPGVTILGGKLYKKDHYLASSDALEQIKSCVEAQLLSEHPKFVKMVSNSFPYLSAPLSKIDVVITDTPIPTEFRNAFTERTQIIPVMRKDSYA